MPIARPEKTYVRLTTPRSVSNCSTLTTEVPRVVCQPVEEEESFCYGTLELEEGEQEVERCEVSFRREGEKDREVNKVCQEVAFEVPKTVCKERPKPFIDY